MIVKMHCSALSQLSIRRACPQDALHLASLYLEATDPQGNLWLSHHRQPQEKLLETGARLFQRRDHPQSYLNCYLAEQSGRIIGLIQTELSYKITPRNSILVPSFSWPQECLVVGLWVVDPNWRGQGVGSRLLQFALEQARPYKHCGLLAPASFQSALQAFNAQLLEPLRLSSDLRDWALKPFFLESAPVQQASPHAGVR